MMTGNKFRPRADECIRAANSMADPEPKLAHLDLAERWLRLATQIDKTDADPEEASWARGRDVASEKNQKRKIEFAKKQNLSNRKNQKNGKS
jgi:hypothetical protein